ncbi:MAG: thymidine phosphorylase [Pikeienuella sp.]|uniref:thymidine phosphorylase n=1 Tax=Pikeienuella sp. TaxID=2831957 RepID=UPI00391B8E1A
MRPQTLIARKRDGGALSASELSALMAALVSGEATAAQGAAFAMAVLLRGMGAEERAALTLAMRDSGRVMRWSLPGPVVDKHSTGGVGDNVSLMLAPALAACGAYVPMISGRGLGHTGGTLDKLSAIPGYNAAPDPEALRAAVASAGCAIVGQTADLAPADRVLYAIRDETGTVESIDLITASILSKKLAAGLDALVMDVKAGSGAFMDGAEAEALAVSLVETGNGAGCRTSALITDMNEPLASAAGNALEVENAAAFLTGERRDPRLLEVTLALGAEALALSGLAADAAEGRTRMEGAFASGAAAERFGRMVAALGGPADILERRGAHLAAAPVVRDVEPAETGFVAAVDGRALGLAVIGLGGGRMKASDRIDLRVGFDRLAGIGFPVGPGAPLGRVHAADEAAAEAGARALAASFRIGEAPPTRPLILKRIGPEAGL